jgi:hypothetical protein
VVPGFLRGRRFVVVDGQPKYLAIYDMNDGVLTSAAYRAVAGNPDEKTQYFVPRMLNASRTVFCTAAHSGEGEGSMLSLVSLAPKVDDESGFCDLVVCELFSELRAMSGIICTTLMKARQENADQTGVATLRKIDRKIDWLLMIESGSSEILKMSNERIKCWLAKEGLLDDAQLSMFRMIYRVAPSG